MVLPSPAEGRSMCSDLPLDWPAFQAEKSLMIRPFVLLFCLERRFLLWEAFSISFDLIS